MAELLKRLANYRRKAIAVINYTFAAFLLLSAGAGYAQNPTDSGNRGALEFQSSPGFERNVPVRRHVDKIRNFRVYAPTKNLTTYTSEPREMQRAVPAEAAGGEMRAAQPARLSTANRMQRNAPPQSIEDLERQIGALEEKLLYARQHPDLFAETDIVKMKGALESKRIQLGTLLEEQTGAPE